LAKRTHRATKETLNRNWTEIIGLKAAGVKVKAIADKFNISRQVLKARLDKHNPDVALDPSDKLKILILDIENAPMLSFSWGLWQQNIQDSMRVEGNRSYMMTVAAKWYGEDEIFYFETRTEDDSKVIRQIMELVDEADLIVGHNAKQFDMKKLNAYALLNGLTPPSPYRVIDTMLIAKKECAFERNTLKYLSGALCKHTKSEHGKFTGFELWSECMKGNEEAWAEMKHYNIQDVLVTEELYEILRPWAKGHPSVVVGSKSHTKRCTSCGSGALVPAGYSHTNVSQFKRYKCEDCGSYSRGRSNQLTKEDREHLLCPVANG